MAKAHRFGVEPITCHAWNKEQTQLAISPNNDEVHIYGLSAGAWIKEHTLSEHTQRVTGIDWAPQSNRIVTCGVDRNAYVWTFNGSKWEPVLVILRINRAATCVKWSPLENKFATGSGARLVSVCYYESENNWWVSKHIKKPIRSTVTCLDWHPNNYLLACGSSDFKARVYSAYVKEAEKKPAANEWGSKLTFAAILGEYSNGGGGWVHSVCFSATGTKLAWVGHDSSISVVDAANNSLIVTVKTNYLPFSSCLWVGESSLVVAGFDNLPLLFKCTAGGITFVNKIDIPKKTGGGSMTAMKRFQQLDNKGRDTEDSKVATLHQNAIRQLTMHSGSKASCAKFASGGNDGQIVVWDIRSLESQIAGLRVS
ncbi:actin-related protein 2/3 complex subunit 1A-B-like [Watersipora subatra]|uniref:actin-related protein 2/3 complex subunit 1A-B-like n=1 Tax=Watersipora subatra TaxID=2589382 RepID=UPI00355B19B3